MLEQMTADELGLFHSLLSKRSDPIPVGRLEGADRRKTVDMLLQQYQTRGSREVTQSILEKMNLNELANQLSWSVCACVCACISACVCVCVRACAHQWQEA